MKNFLLTTLIVFLLPLSALAATAKVLVVAGGGSGARGGGGAGGVQYDSALTVTAQAYTVTIGAGGAEPSLGGAVNGNDGSNSAFGSITATGGGGGGAYVVGQGNDGGSGGGAGSYGAASPVQGVGAATGGNTFGNAGGGSNAYYYGAGYPSGGGGGAGAAGQNAQSNTQSGAGGAGIGDASVGGLLTDASAGVGGYIAGGGGGGEDYYSGSGGAGGSGGGGRGADDSADNAVAGTANTGGGGGGSGSTSGNYHARAGGSGIVIIEYTTSDFSGFTYTGSHSTGENGAYTWVKMTSSGTLTLTAGGGGFVATTTLQDLNYTYDATGNITSIFDLSGTNAYAKTFFTYDNLYRLTSASTTNATTTNWIQTYAYNDLGNITSKSDVGSYTYAGTGWANPHAPTTINGVTYTYDKAGNLTGYGSNSFSWNYRNRLIDTNNNGTSTHYLYDFNDQRVQQDVKIGASATSSTKYFSKLFETKGATTTLYVFLPNGELLATVEGNGSATSTYIAHTDHQGSTNVMSDKNGALAQLNTYYPFGAKRNNEIPANGIVNERGFIGQYEDAVVQLSYLNARYYDITRGQFASQDPLVQKIGLDLKAVQQLLLDPQLQNYYSYARNNPINLSDPSGEATIGQLLSQISALLTQLSAAIATQYGQYSSGVKQGVEHPIDSAKTIATGNAQSTAQTIGMTVGVTAQTISMVGAISSGAGLLRTGYKALTSTTLYRAVLPGELEDLNATKGLFRLKPGGGNNEVKFFSPSKESLSEWVKRDVTAYPKNTYTIVETSIPKSALNAEGVSVMTVDFGLPAVMLPEKILPLLTPAIW